VIAPRWCWWRNEECRLADKCEPRCRLAPLSGYHHWLYCNGIRAPGIPPEPKIEEKP